MNELLAKYKRETGKAANPHLEFSDLDGNDCKTPDEKKAAAITRLNGDGFLNDFYLVDKDFMDWLVSEASK